jgi:TonB family protein
LFVSLIPRIRAGDLSAIALLILAFSAFGQNAAGPPSSVISQNLPVAGSPIEVLTDTQGVDFGVYVKDAMRSIRRHWYPLIPQSAFVPTLERGTAVMEFAIQRDGQLTGLHVTSSSGDKALDSAAYGGIAHSNPFPPLPSEFKGPFLGLRVKFIYNQQSREVQDTIGLPAASLASKNLPEAVRLSEILISTGSQTTSVGHDRSEQIAAASAKANDLLAKIRAGASFDDLAKTNSDDISAARGGDLGLFERGKLAKVIEDVVFAMKPGDVSDVIRTKQGFMILKVTDHRGKGADISPAATNPQ